MICIIENGMCTADAQCTFGTCDLENGSCKCDDGHLGDFCFGKCVTLSRFSCKKIVLDYIEKSMGQIAGRGYTLQIFQS